MEKRLFFSIFRILKIACLVNVFVFFDVETSRSETVVFNSAGSTTWTVPCEVTSISVKAWGGGGGGGAGGSNSAGGNGAGAGFAQATLTVTPGETLNIYLGGGGGGGSIHTNSGDGGGGGGRSEVERGSTSLIIAAGGGAGGGGDNSSATAGGAGGPGGGTTGTAGSSSGTAGGGGGGTQSGGGSGGTGGGTNGAAGASKSGGAGANGGSSAGTGATGNGGTVNGGSGGQGDYTGSGWGGGGGGGCGYYGGGGGSCSASGNAGGGGGGGGSSYTTGTGTSTSSGSGRNAGNNTDGDYADNAGYGGANGSGGAGRTNGGAGNPGRIVITYTDPPETPFSYRKSITVNSGQVSGGPHTDFPMLVSLTDNDLRPTANGGDVTSSSGYDIIFRALDDTTCGGSGTAPCTLDHEIEFYDGTPDDVTLSGGWYMGTGSYTVPAGKNRLLVFVSGFENSGDRNITNVTFGGVNMTQAVEDVVGTTTVARTEIWYLKDASIPASGSFVVTYSGGTPTNPMHAYALFTNVDQTSPIEDTASNPTTTSDPVTATVDVVQGGMSIAGATCGNNGSYTWGNGWTEGTDQTSGATTTMSTAHHQNSASGTDTASADHSSTINRQVLVVASLRPGGELVAWVRVPSITDGTVIYIYYGNGCITSPTENPTGVWDSNYKGVWHLHDDFEDSTSSNNDGTNNGSTNLAAKIANAQDFDGVDDYISISRNSSIEPSTAITFQAWVKWDDYTASSYGAVINKPKETDIDPYNSYTLEQNAATQTIQPGITVSGTDFYATSQSITQDAWHHLVVTWSSGNYIRFYIDGSQASTSSSSYSGSITYYNTPLTIGINNTSGSGSAIDGTIDEVRISSTARSSGWIATEHNNQSAPSSFYSIGSETSSAPTAVLLSSFAATEYDGRVLLQWKTGYEANNLGFNVYREEDGQLIQVNSELISGGAFLAGAKRATAGHSYAWWDTSANPELSAISHQPSDLSTPTPTLPPRGGGVGWGAVRYWLEDVDLSGKRPMNGPVTPNISLAPPPEKGQAALLSQLSRGQSEKERIYSRLLVLQNRLRNTQSSRKAELVVSGVDTGSRSGTLPSGLLGLSDKPGQTVILPSGQEKKLTPQEVQWVLAGLPGLKLFIQEEGWYRITQPELVAAGLDPRINPRNLQLYADGQEQAILLNVRRDGQFGSQDSLEFYGTGLDTAFTETRVYWLVVGAKPGRRVSQVGGLTGEVGWASFPYAVEKKPRTIYFAALKNGEAENFFGPLVSTTPLEQVLSVYHHDPAPPGETTLEVSLQGATEGTHQVQVQLNGVQVGSLLFEEQSRGVVALPVSQSLPLEGENRVTLVAQGGEMDVSLVDYIRLTYWHSYTADENALRFTADGGQQIWVDGFSNSQIRVVDITDPKLVQEVVGEVRQQGLGYAVRFSVPGSGQRTLLTFAGEQVKSAAAIEANQTSRWYQAGWSADLVIISSASFLESVRPLKALREAQGWSVALVDVEDIYDEFGFGIKSSQALKDFLLRAKTHWQKSPRFVLLAGDASVDPRNYLGLGDYDLVPTKLIDTAVLETASDDWFVDFNGDGLPEMAVGRLPVRTVEEAQVVISKIVGYEQSAQSLRDVLLVADMKGEEDLDFEGASSTVGALLPAGLMVRNVFRGQFTDDVQVHSELLGGWNEGKLLVNYLGHGSLAIWRGDIFTSDDAAALTNGLRLPFVVSMTCLNGFFHDPSMDGLAEALLKARQGGAVAVWASSGLTEPEGQSAMDKELVRVLFNGESLTLGEAVQRAKAATSDSDVRRSWILFGDPMTRLKY